MNTTSADDGRTAQGAKEGTPLPRLFLLFVALGIFAVAVADRKA